MKYPAFSACNGDVTGSVSFGPEHKYGASDGFKSGDAYSICLCKGQTAV